MNSDVRDLGTCNVPFSNDHIFRVCTSEIGLKNYDIIRCFVIKCLIYQGGFIMFKPISY